MVAINAIKEKHGFEYDFGSASHELYEASGCSEDWGKEVAKINHTFVIELKPKDINFPQTGFVFPESEIEQAASEIYDGFIEYIKSFFIKNVSESVRAQCQEKMARMQQNSDDEHFDYEYDYY